MYGAVTPLFFLACCLGKRAVLNITLGAVLTTSIPLLRAESMKQPFSQCHRVDANKLKHMATPALGVLCPAHTYGVTTSLTLLHIV
jgi:hypothetical protein